MNESIIRALGLAVLSYDEANIEKHIDFLFRDSLISPEKPDYKFETRMGKHGYYFYGVVTDHLTSSAYPFCRGTDGDDLIGKAMSWYTNFQAWTGKNDIHDGFENEGNDWFNWIKTILYKVTSIYPSGQSQGAPVSQYFSKLCYENLSEDKNIFHLGISVPPWCRTKTRDIMNVFSKERFKSLAFYHDPDPVCCRGIYRKAKACRIGKWIKLDCSDRYSVGSINPVTHSCKMYVDSIIKWGIKHDVFTIAGLKTLVGISERCVN